MNKDAKINLFGLGINRHKIMGSFEARVEVDDPTVEGKCHVVNKNAEAKVANFSEIEGNVSKFSGDGPYDVRKWILDFESVANSVGCDESRDLEKTKRECLVLYFADAGI